MLRCPDCGLAHFPDEVHRESERGLAYNGRLAKARAAVGPPQPLEAIKAAPQKAFVKGKGGRPAGPSPWKARKQEHLRAYMRGYRARKKGGEACPS